MTEQVLQETLQAWLDAVAALQIDIVEMSDILAPHSIQQPHPLPSTLFILEGEVPQLIELWRLTKHLEAFPIVYSWKYANVLTAPRNIPSFFSLFLLLLPINGTFCRR